MNSGSPLTSEERARIYAGRQLGKTIVALAQDLQRSPAVVRKWWRRFRDQGWQEPPPRGRPMHGILASFDAEVRAQAIAVKRTHPRWGAARVKLELEQLPVLQAKRLPSRSRLATAFHQLCPEAVGRHEPRSAPTSAPPLARAVHEVWQIDHQEKHALGDGTLATVCNVRDPVGAAMLMSRAFSTRTPKRWRKLTTEEVQTVLRQAFDEWHTLPDSVLTDNELGLVGAPQDRFPSRLTLWLRGLGIVHQRIRPHRPTDQPQIERNHRTLDNLTGDVARRTDLLTFQAALDHERQVYNQTFPCRASDCHGQPPLTAHPALLQPRRPYPPDGELAVFDLQLVFDYLATFTFARHISSQGHLTLGQTAYYMSNAHFGKNVWVRCDPVTQEWLVYERSQPTDPTTQVLLARLKIRRLDTQTLTGRTPQPVHLAQPLQLSLPCLAPAANAA